jgi:hypothetical protein
LSGQLKVYFGTAQVTRAGRLFFPGYYHKLLHCTISITHFPMPLENSSPGGVDPEKMAETMADVIAQPTDCVPIYA